MVGIEAKIFRTLAAFQATELVCIFFVSFNACNNGNKETVILNILLIINQRATFLQEWQVAKCDVLKSKQIITDCGRCRNLRIKKMDSSQG